MSLESGAEAGTVAQQQLKPTLCQYEGWNSDSLESHINPR